MKAARKISTLVTVLFVLAGTVLAQEHHDGNLAERQKAPTVLGGTGLFNTFSTRTLCKGEFNFALFWNNYRSRPRRPEHQSSSVQLYRWYLTNRWELWVDWNVWTNTTSRQPFLLSGYQLSASRFFGNPFKLLGPPVGGKDKSAAFFPGTGAFARRNTSGARAIRHADRISRKRFFTGGRRKARQVRGLGPLIAVNLPSYYPEFPFFGELDFQGFDSSGTPVFGPRESSNGSGDVYIGTKFNLIDPNHHWFSMALGGYLKIPISSSDGARARDARAANMSSGRS